MNIDIERSSPSKIEQNIQWRRSKVIELNSEGYSQPETARILQVSIGTVNRDLSIIRKQARNNLQSHITKGLPEEYHRCLIGLNQVLKTCWSIINKQYGDDRTKLQAAAIANDCYDSIMDLCTNEGIILDAINSMERKKEQLDTLKKIDERIGKVIEEEETEAEGEETTTNGIF